MKLLDTVFEPIKSRGGCVGAIWLNPADIPFLKEWEGMFDEIHVPQLRIPDVVLPGVYEGVLFGAMILSTDIVPKGHAIWVPEGIKVSAVEGTAAFSLGWT